MAAGDVVTPLLTILSASSATNSATFTNTAPSVLTPTVGIAFTAPPSGAVLVIGSVYLRNRNASYATYGGVRVKTGSTLDAGTTVLDPAAEPNAQALLQDLVGQMSTSIVMPLTGLTPGAAYNACLVGWVSNAAGSGDHYSRRVDIITL